MLIGAPKVVEEHCVRRKTGHVFFQGLAEVYYAQLAEFCRQGGNVAHEGLHFEVERGDA
jgi:hypothetical protein